MLLHDTTVTAGEFEAGTGWALKPQGACRGELCIPLRDTGQDDSATDESSDPDTSVDVAAIAEQIGLPLVHDADHDLWALGPWAGTGRALVDARAPELVLPDLDGHDFRLSSLRGQKVLILSWAPY